MPVAFCLSERGVCMIIVILIVITIVAIIAYAIIKNKSIEELKVDLPPIPLGIHCEKCAARSDESRRFQLRRSSGKAKRSWV